MISSDCCAPHDARFERARALVMRFGWNAVSYQILNSGIEWWFSNRHEAVIGFVRRHRVRVVAGAPICAAENLADVVDEWETHARCAGDRVCYFGAAGRLHDLLHQKTGYSTVVLGAQPVWEPKQWPLETKRSLRAQEARARNKGVVVSEWPASGARFHPQLKAILEQWLRTRGLPSLHFLVEPRTLNCLGDRRLFVAQIGEDAVGFVVLAPVPMRAGYLTEQFVRGAKAPNGTVELMLGHAVSVVAGEGAQYVTMGLVPLSLRGSENHSDPLWLRVVLERVRAHGKRFYNFEGLERFKDKFQPADWEPIYAIANETHFSPRVLYAVAAAFTRRPVWVALVLGLRRAVRQELKWKRSPHWSE